MFCKREKVHYEQVVIAVCEVFVDYKVRVLWLEKKNGCTFLHKYCDIA